MSTTATQRDALRARIILLRSQGKKEAEVAKTVGTSVNTVSLWSKRFESGGLVGLSDEKGRGRKPWLPAEKVRQVITRVTQPPKGKKKWSTRSMAAAVGISHHSVHQIWRRNDLKPHLVRTFKISNDPDFETKFWDVIGLYLQPPDEALVLCCDEKSQCQALERTQPGLPLGIGHIRTKTHDYKRHGTITLFAALNYLEGKLITRTEPHHTHVEWLRFHWLSASSVETARRGDKLLDLLSTPQEDIRAFEGRLRELQPRCWGGRRPIVANSIARLSDCTSPCSAGSLWYWEFTGSLRPCY